ncbi:hypothetical protein CBL_11190 [Carabus blaptoides fortunei]
MRGFMLESLVFIKKVTFKHLAVNCKLKQAGHSERRLSNNSQSAINLNLQVG